MAQSQVRERLAAYTSGLAAFTSAQSQLPRLPPIAAMSHRAVLLQSVATGGSAATQNSVTAQTSGNGSARGSASGAAQAGNGAAAAGGADAQVS